MRSIAKQETTNKSTMGALFAALVAALLIFAAGSSLVAFADDAEGASEKAAQLSTQADDESDGSPSASPAAVTPQEDASVKASPENLKLVVGGEAETVTLTLVDCSASDLKLVTSDDDVVKCSDITEKSGKVSFTVEPVAADDKSADVKIVKADDEDTVLATVKATVNMRKVTITAVAAAASKATIEAKVDSKKIQPVSTSAMGDTFGVTAKQDVAYTVSAKGYDDKSGTVKKGASDAEEKVTLSPTTYKISYKLDGGTNAEGNPNSYTIESDDIKLASPTREDYAFTGWTTATQTKLDKTFTIKSGSTGNQTFTANWKKLKSGMEVTAPDAEFAYDGKDHSIAVNSTNVSNTTVYYSSDSGETYADDSVAYSDPGEYTIYYKVVDNDQVYASAKGSAKLTIKSPADEVTDSTTGIVAKGDIFKKYTTDHKVVELSVADLTNSTEKASHITELRNKHFDSTKANLFKVYDVSLELVDYSDADNVSRGEITSDFGSLVVTFPVDKSLNGKAAHVYEQHEENGKTTEINFANLKVNDGKVQVTVNKLSEFVLVVDKTDATTTKGASSSSGSTAAKTGDTISPVLPIAIAIIAIAAIAFAVYRMRKLR